MTSSKSTYQNLKKFSGDANYKLDNYGIYISTISIENSTKKWAQEILIYDFLLKQNYTTIMQLPRLDKIVLNTTSKIYVNDKKHILNTLAALELISGQKPQLTLARKSVANFKVRQDQILGCKVVLRENLMYAFLDKLSKIVFPRIREFSDNLSSNSRLLQLNKKASTFGFQNLMLFPELEKHYELVDAFRGMNITFVLKNANQKSTNLSLILSGYQLPVA
jgi:large subunit ribosomal protein L5